MDQLNATYKLVIEKYIAAYNAKNVEEMVRDLSVDVVFEHLTNDEVSMRLEGLDAFRRQAEEALSYFSHRKQTVLSWEFAGDLVRVEVDYQAVLAVDFPNGLKAGERLHMSGISEFTFENDKTKAIKDRS
ncbi:nuclear transport factor 2 family protein [Cyclobacterium xiamenense]|uniref:nuclear transport factor 2 family protein n=1 Tax=Cyclobacterium xiamenense TaxID=1297121 RepID=UPI001386B711|nr:nuclear transport factor 2 family protein [Cyclobacterium xiamenense]